MCWLIRELHDSLKIPVLWILEMWLRQAAEAPAQTLNRFPEWPRVWPSSPLVKGPNQASWIMKIQLHMIQSHHWSLENNHRVWQHTHSHLIGPDGLKRRTWQEGDSSLSVSILVWNSSARQSFHGATNIVIIRCIAERRRAAWCQMVA